MPKYGNRVIIAESKLTSTPCQRNGGQRIGKFEILQRKVDGLYADVDQTPLIRLFFQASVGYTGAISITATDRLNIKKFSFEGVLK